MSGADTVGSLLAGIANLLGEALRNLMFADKRQWGPDEFEQVRALEDALDEAKKDFQELGPLVNGQFYYENDRRREFTLSKPLFCGWRMMRGVRSTRCGRFADTISPSQPSPSTSFAICRKGWSSTRETSRTGYEQAGQSTQYGHERQASSSARSTEHNVEPRGGYSQEARN